MNLLPLEFKDGSVDDYYADEERLCQSGAQTQKVGDKTYLFGDDGTRVKEAGFQTVVDENRGNAYLLSECRRQHRISWKPHRISAGRPYRKLADSRFYLVLWWMQKLENSFPAGKR